MHVEVDQSGKIEDTATDTVLAFSNEADFAILIPAKVKRVCLRRLRNRGKAGKSIYWLVFALGSSCFSETISKSFPVSSLTRNIQAIARLSKGICSIF